MKVDDKIKIKKTDLAVLPLSATQTGEWAISWSDAPYALVLRDDSGRVMPDAGALWGLPHKMTVEEAWEDFDYADMYELE